MFPLSGYPEERILASISAVGRIVQLVVTYFSIVSDAAGSAAFSSKSRKANSSTVAHAAGADALRQ